MTIAKDNVSSRRLEELASSSDPEDASGLAVLVEVGSLLGAGEELGESLRRVATLLGRRYAGPALAVLVDVPREDLRLEVHSDLAGGGRSLLYDSIEGVIAAVMDTRNVVVQARRGEAARFQGVGRIGAGEVWTLVCAPIEVGGRAVGALAVEVPGRGEGSGEMAAAVRVVAGMIGQAARASWSAELERLPLLEENTQLREELRERYECAGLIGGSGPMRHLYAQVTQVAHTRATVLIRGESGTGKELIARAVHLRSPRADKPFVTVNCAALPPTLIESELFGHEKGAFTGALGRKLGLFERANGGTLFLDEIGDLEIGMQAKLLRVLQQREIHRIGGSAAIPVDVRVIAATHRDLEAAISDGRFREDLYYRLNVFSIFAPPLRERKTDVLALAEHFVQKYGQEYGKEIRRISTPAIDVLASYHWPGNVRELENVIVRAMLTCDGPVIHAHHLPPMLQTAGSSDTVLEGSLTDIVGSFEKSVIEDTLKTTGGNKMKAARILRTTQRILNYRIQRYRIDCDRFRS